MVCRSGVYRYDSLLPPAHDTDLNVRHKTRTQTLSIACTFKNGVMHPFTPAARNTSSGFVTE